MSSSQYTTSPQNPFPTRKYQSHHQQWPYDSKLDFSRYDEADDNSFYTQPRFVAHIDDAALARLTTYYSNVVPSSGTVLDLCTSWRSWYSPSHQEAVADGSLKVHGIGLNAAELAANPLFSDFPERWKVLDLNREELDANEEFDCVTCTVSVDYLVKAVDVLSSVRKCTKEGGKVHLAVSNRCFPSKAVRIWLGMSTEERLGLVGDYLQFSGWKDIEIVDLCARDAEGNRVTDDNGTAISGEKLEGSATHLDPLWIVRGVKG